jgi:hypothetical protein
VYNASQKIIRAVFHGAPNLFTAPDINRQLDVFDHRFGMLEGFLPATSDMTFNVANGEAKMTYSYLEVAGVQLYKGSSKTDVITDGFYNDDHLIGLYVKRKLVTYANDGADHLISGAVFVDGTSMAAADHYVISDYGFVVGTAQSGTTQWVSLPSDAEVVSVVYSFNVLLGAGLRSRVPNTLPKGYPMVTKIINTVVNLFQYQPSTVKYEIPTEQLGSYATGLGGVAYFYMDNDMLMVSFDAQVAFNNTEVSPSQKVLTASIPLSSVFSQTWWDVNAVLSAGGATTTTNTGEAQNPFVVVCPAAFLQKPGNIAHTEYKTYVTIETQGETSLRMPTVKLCIQLAARSVVGIYSCRFRGQLIVPNTGRRV